MVAPRDTADPPAGAVVARALVQLLPARLVSRARVDPYSDCPCVRDHSPRPTRLQRHLILPRRLGGTDAPSNCLELCPATHDAAHHALDLLLRHGPLGHVDLRKFPHFARELARMALEEWLAHQWEAHRSLGWPAVEGIGRPID